MTNGLARVVAAHPESHTVDVTMMDSGLRLPGVKVMCPMAGTNIGWNDLPQPDVTTPTDRYATGATGTRDILAGVLFFGAVPVVVGFLFPEVSQLMFADPGRFVYRHGSDVYVTIDARGNTELAHPSGAYVRIGTTTAHEDLTGRDVDKAWKIARNTGQSVHVHLAAGGCALDLAPDGNLTITCSGNVDINSASLKHNGVNIGATHRHGGVQTGGSDTGTAK